jgi:hypothetical protein
MAAAEDRLPGMIRPCPWLIRVLATVRGAGLPCGDHGSYS